jgi:NitT/TauT family transport system substrate-binding protein
MDGLQQTTTRGATRRRSNPRKVPGEPQEKSVGSDLLARPMPNTSGTMKHLFVLPLAVAGSLILMLGAGCGRPQSAAPAVAAPMEPITVQLDWVPEPEHGGFYQAQARGFFTAAGLEVVINPGGPNAFATQKIATGQADIAQADSTNVLLAIAEGLPIVHIGAVFQNDPSVLMLHADNPITRFEDLNGKTIMARPEWAFLPYLRKKYGIDFALIPQNFSVANFIVNPAFIQQGFYIAEPFHIVRGGAKPPKFLYAWDAGFDAYTVLAANRGWTERHPERVRRFLAAYIRGWQDYLEGDPAPAHDLMKRLHPSNSDDFLAFSRKMIIDERLVIGRVGGSNAQIGRVSRDRFATQIRQLEELGIVPAGRLSVDQVVDTRFLPASP